MNRCRRRPLHRHLRTDLDAEGIWAAVICGDHELVAALAVDRSFTLELCRVASHDEPVVAGAAEVQVTGVELELGVPVGHVSTPFLLLGSGRRRWLCRSGLGRPCKRRRVSRSSRRR